MNCSKDNEVRKPNPILEAGFLSKWAFWWTREIFKRGFIENLQSEHLYAHIPSLDSKKLSNEIIKHWTKEVRCKNPNLLLMLFRIFGWKFVSISILYHMLEITIHTIQPLFLGGLVSYFMENQNIVSRRMAYFNAAGIVICSLVSTLCRHPFKFFVFEIGTGVRIACCGLVYRKCLRSSVTSDNTGISGSAIALLSSDLAKFDSAFLCFHDLWRGPVEACIFSYIMYRAIGWPAFVGLATITAFIPAQAWAANATARYRQQFAEFADQRVKLMNEIIMAMQVIKMYAWEKSFGKMIAFIRQRELRAIRGSMKVFAALQCTEMISKLALFLSLIAYVYNGDIVTAQKVFIVSFYYSLLNESLLHFWPLAVITWAEMMVSANRVVLFLVQREDPVNGGIENTNGSDAKNKGNFSGRMHNPRAIMKDVILHHLSASWDKKVSNTATRRLHINDVHFHIHQRQFVGIVGNVGSGKSTLLSAILGELEILQGSVEVNGVVSYASQEPWVFDASVRDNILFGERYDQQRYKAVLHACGLEREMELLPFGDSTIVGDRGISVSGGQKARINLARSVYRQADIYIFDDPLSGLDAQAGKQLVKNCMMEFLSDKIRILVTHRLQHLPQTDHLILMEAGRADVQGPYNDLKNLLRFRIHQELEADIRLSLHHADSIVEEDSCTDRKQKTIPQDEGVDRREQLMQGSVKCQTYLAYFKALSYPWMVLVIFILFLLARCCQAAMEIFISKWASWEETMPNKHESHMEYATKRVDMICYYTLIVISTLILYVARTFGFFVMCLQISQRLHERLFAGIIRARMYFFDNNPSGRILNRFSSDTENVDIDVPQLMMESISFFLNAFSVLVVVAVANYWLLIPGLLVICLLYLCRGLYIGAARSLKRLEIMTRSPIYSHTNQTIQGLTTIRALNASELLEQEFHDHLNSNTSALYLYTSTYRAFAFWTDLICVLYILLVTFSFLVINREFVSGNVGLAITQSLTLVTMVHWGMLQTAEMENNMTSVERIIEYAETPSEPSLDTDLNSTTLSAEWPSTGALHIRDLRLCYSEKGSYVLKGLNLSIRPREKLGIVGRTGAGKSSIIKAIFRLARYQGTIDIDGCDIEKLGLHDLRSRISIIPQDPVLFSGTLRYNLDPFDEKTDEEVWRALEDVKLKAHVSSLEGGLNCRMHDGGLNFSMGQRQLVCMARAILRHNKILIMDEPTANVDIDTDKLLLETIHTIFEACTVITIAHRLHSVMDNDRVVVVEDGQVVQLGHPYELLQNRDGHLYRLVMQTGKGTAKSLKRIAEQSYKKRVTNKQTISSSD